MDALEKFRKEASDGFNYWKGFLVAWALAMLLATVLLLVTPACAQGLPVGATTTVVLRPDYVDPESGVRRIVIRDRPLSDGVIEIAQDDIAIDDLLLAIWDLDPGLSRGVLVVGGQEPPKLKIRYIGSVRDLDAAIGGYLESVGG